MDTNYLSFLNAYKELLGLTKGIDTQSIKKIEMAFNVVLPEAYKEFLSLFGHESGNFLGSYYTEFPALLDNKNDALYSLNFDDRKEDKPQIKDAFSFLDNGKDTFFIFLIAQKVMTLVYIF